MQPEFTRCEPFGTERLQSATPGLRVAWSKCNPSSPVASPSAPRGYRLRRLDCELRGLVQPEFTRCEPFGTEVQSATLGLRVAWSKCNPSSPVASPSAPRGYRVRRLDCELRGLSATRVHPLQALRHREATECDAGLEVAWSKCNPSSPIWSPSAPRGYRVRRLDCEFRGLSATRVHPLGALPAPRGYRVRRLDCELRGLSATRVHPLRALRHREVTECDASTASCVV